MVVCRLDAARQIVLRTRNLATGRQAGRVKRLALVVLGLAWLAACSSSGVPACKGGTPPSTGLSGYRLGPRDQVQVTVFRQPDMSGLFTIDGEGFLALPLVGEFKAGGLTTRDLEDQIEARLKKDQFLVNPQVSIELKTYRSFYVLGEVNHPGSYEFRDGMTVTNGVALAGGFTYRANQGNASIEREGCAFPARVDTLVQPGDIITVPERYF
jgi:protein involved in polysaccharide export with SLBB domain